MYTEWLHRRTVFEYFHGAIRRISGPGPADFALRVFAEDGNWAAFVLRLEEGRIVEARYRCTTCATLVALCEHATELVRGMTVGEARGLAPEVLLAVHPEIPLSRQPRALLTVAALRHALDAHSLGGHS